MKISLKGVMTLLMVTIRIPIQAQIVDARWNRDANADWNVITNWIYHAGSTFPNGVDHIARLTNNITQGREARLQVPITLGHLYIGDIDSSHNFTVQKGTAGTLTFDVATSNATINKSFGNNDNLNVPVYLNDDLLVNLTGGNAPLTFSDTLSLDTNSLTILTGQSLAGNVGVVLGGSISGTGHLILKGTKYSAFGRALSTTALQPTGSGANGRYDLSLNGAANHSGKTVLLSGILMINQTGSSGSLLNTSAIEFRGGGLCGAHPEGSTNMIGDSIPFVVDGGGVYAFMHPKTAPTPPPSETVGPLDLRKGTFEFRLRSDAAATNPVLKQFLFEDLVRTGAFNTATVAFGPTTGAGAGWSNIHGRLFFNKFQGAPATNMAFLGPWAVYGNYQGFAAYDTVNGVTQAMTLALSAASNNENTNFRTAGNVTLNPGINPSYQTLAFRVTASETVNLNGNTVTLHAGGLTFGGDNDARSHVLSNGVIRVGPAANNQLYIHSGMQQATTGRIWAVISDNGTNPLTVVKAGPGIVQFDGVMTYSGATVINCGLLRLGGDNRLPPVTTLTVQRVGDDPTHGFSLNGFNQTVAGLTGDGFVHLGPNTLTVTNLLQTINPAAPLTLLGSGTLALEGGSRSGFTLDGNMTLPNVPLLWLPEGNLSIGTGCRIELRVENPPVNLPATFTLAAASNINGAFSSAQVVSPSGLTALLTHNNQTITLDLVAAPRGTLIQIR